MSLSATATTGGAKAINRTVPQLYRDCLRLIQHIAGRSKKGDNIRLQVNQQFRRPLVDAGNIAEIEARKSDAIRALANYLMIQSATKDSRLSKVASNYASREANSIKSPLGSSPSNINGTGRGDINSGSM